MQWNVYSIYEDCGRKTCVKFIEIELGASHLPAGEASVSDALSEGRKRILLIHQGSSKERGAS